MMNRLLIILFFFGTAFVLHSCVENGLEFPDSQERETTSSKALTTLLNEIQLEHSNSELCFDFVYPLVLEFNSSVTINAASLEGVEEAAVNQTSELYIRGIAFPFEVLFGQDTAVISDEANFNNLLRECGINTFTDTFFKGHLQCFELQYPVTISDIEKQPQQISSVEELFIFKENQGEGYELDFVYPLNVISYAQDEVDTIKSDFDFYEVFNACEACPDISYSSEQVSTFVFKFKYNFEIQDDYIVMWFVNGKLDPFYDASWNGNWEVPFEVDFDPGEYEICLVVQTPTCALGIEYCDDIKVEDPCPDLFFKVEQEGDTPAYLFTAEFEKRDEIPYTWIISINNDVLFTKTIEPGSGEHTLFYQFSPGVYEICIVSETPECPEGVFYCEELEVRQ